MRLSLYTLNVNDYEPAITALTYPLMQRFAKKIGATWRVITERRFPAWPIVYEKLQIHDLIVANRDDWAWYIDGDALIHPDMFNVVDHLTPDTVCHHGIDMAGNRWRYDDYFRRSQSRHVGSCNWNTCASAWCRDLWRPLDDLTPAQAVENIFPIQAEVATVITREHLVDDYALSRNIARFGLKVTSILKITRDLGDAGSYFWHQYTATTQQKLHGWIDESAKCPENPEGRMAGMYETLKRWKV